MNDTKSLPRLVSWTGYLAITLLLLVPLSVLMVRSGAWQQGLLLYAVACLGATALLALVVLLLLLPGYAEWRPALRRRGLLATPGTLLLFLLVSGGGKYPPIHDISTDVDDPPLFSEAAVTARGTGSNPVDINPEAITAQQLAYPDLDTLRTDVPIDRAFDLALQVAGNLGWEIYTEDLSLGLIEAVDTTAVMAFRDDVAIRVRSNADGTLLDLRSVSRVGRGDLGANAKRIREFVQAFSEAAEQLQ